MVFAGEVGCWPDAALCAWVTPQGQAMLNAGTFAGRAADLLDMLEGMAARSVTLRRWMRWWW